MNILPFDLDKLNDTLTFKDLVEGDVFTFMNDNSIRLKVRKAYTGVDPKYGFVFLFNKTDAIYYDATEADLDLPVMRLKHSLTIEGIER